MNLHNLSIPVTILKNLCIFRKKYFFNSNHLKRVSTLDSNWVAAAAPGLGLGLQAHNSPAWLGVYLAVCKLLDQVPFNFILILNKCVKIHREFFFWANVDIFSMLYKGAKLPK